MAEWRLHLAPRCKKVLLIDGGFAGCEAVRLPVVQDHNPCQLRGSRRALRVGDPRSRSKLQPEDHSLITQYEATLASLRADIALRDEVIPAMIEAATRTT